MAIRERTLADCITLTGLAAASPRNYAVAVLLGIVITSACLLVGFSPY